MEIQSRSFKKMNYIRFQKFSKFQQNRIRLKKLAIEELPEGPVREHALTPDLSPCPEEAIVTQVDPPPEDVDSLGEVQQYLLIDARTIEPLDLWGDIRKYPVFYEKRKKRKTYGNPFKEYLRPTYLRQNWPNWMMPFEPDRIIP